ncbi:MAG: cytochrome c biogenesis protein [Candidatus Woesebacteria bacterium]|jgi:cytochrome c biogenesis protein CcdA/glutaredoxin
MFAKKLIAFILALFVFLGNFSFVDSQETKKIYLFYGRGCPHCSEVLEFFEEEGLHYRYPVEVKEIYFDRENAVFFNELLDSLDIPSDARGVPTVVIGEKVIVGDVPIIGSFVSEADEYLQDNESTQEGTNDAESEEEEGIDLTLAAVIGASVVDAINPCAFAVLIILMSAILATGDSRKALKTGLAFAASIFISYFLMGLGLYRALGVGGISGLFYRVVGWLAIVLGLLNLKDYFWYGKGFLMEVPMAWRPKLKGILRSVTSPLGAFGVGFIVSLILLPCTSGPYIVILGMLAERALQMRAISYLVLYNLIFVLPMIIISWAVYKGFKPERAEKMRQRRLRTLHLIAGIIMIAMGAVILAGWI